jgi:hypothetical protein
VPQLFFPQVILEVSHVLFLCYIIHRVTQDGLLPLLFSLYYDFTYILRYHRYEYQVFVINHIAFTYVFKNFTP